MGKIKVTETNLTDVKIIEPAVFGDHRGFFTESYSVEAFKAAGIDFDFIQDNHSLSTQPGVLRGLHFQKGSSAQTKLIRVVTGAVLDVIRQLLVPRGFAHGFVTLTPNVNFMYKCDNYYDAEADGGISFADPDLAIDWPIDIEKAITSEKDAKQPTLKEFEAENPFVYGEI